MGTSMPSMNGSRFCAYFSRRSTGPAQSSQLTQSRHALPLRESVSAMRMLADRLQDVLVVLHDGEGIVEVVQ